MSNLKINENQHLGKQELNRLVKFIKEDGYKKLLSLNASSFGFVKSASDSTFESLKPIQGVVVGGVTLKSGYAIDGDMNVLTNNSDNVDIVVNPNDGVPRYLKVKFAVNPEEVGTVSLAIDGTITGTGTLFTEVMRGGKNHPSKIVFINSASNLLEYTVLSVSSNTSAVVQGAAFTAEADLTYKVVGSFDTPVVPLSSKDVFQYDSCEISFDTTQTTLANEYVVAEVRTVGGVTEIKDLREDSIFSLEYSNVSPTVANPLIGHTEAKYDTKYSAKSNTLLTTSWGFDSLAGGWSFNSTNNQLTITAGSGGIWQSVSSFVNGSFDNWQLLEIGTGQIIKILTSITSSGNILLQLAGKPSLIASNNISILPIGENVELEATPTTSVPNSKKIFNFSIYDSIVR